MTIFGDLLSGETLFKDYKAKANGFGSIVNKIHRVVWYFVKITDSLFILLL